MTVSESTIKPGDFYLRNFSLKEVIAVRRYDGPHGSGYRVAYLNTYGDAHGLSGTTIWLEEVKNVIVRSSDADAKRREGFNPYTTADAPWLTSIKYGTPEEIGLAFLTGERVYTRSNVRNFLVNDDMVSRVLNNHDLTMLVCNLYLPKGDEGSAISLIRTEADRKRDRRTTMKPGKAFRLMFPALSDKDVAIITEAWIELTSPRKLTLHVSKSREAFAEAYDGDRSSYRNPVTTGERKSLATSCMQHVGRDVMVDGASVYTSVGEVYASGDFTIAYLKDKDGLIAGRVVYSDVDDEPCFAGPLYGACEQSLDELQSHLDDVGAKYHVEGWDGLRFNMIGGSDNPLAPYVDGDVGGNPSRCGNYIILERWGGQYGFESTDGHVSSTLYCEGCEEGLHEDQAYTTDYGYYCEGCFDETYVVLENGDTVLREDAVEAFHVNWRGTVSTSLIHQDESVYCEALDQYWHVDDVTVDEDGFSTPTHLLPDEDENNEEAA